MKTGGDGMHWIDWVIVAVPFLVVVAVAAYTQRYVKGVADFLAARRVAGRYVVAVSSGEAAMGLISVVAVFELYYQSGFAIGFWGALATPVSLVIALTGFCIYRYRESRAMTGFIFMNCWVGTIYPAITLNPEVLAGMTSVVEGVSRPLEPIIRWRVTPDSFFMNGQEVYLLVMLASIFVYVTLSLLTCRQPFNMERMLHRGVYRRDDDTALSLSTGLQNGSFWRRLPRTLSGIDEQFTRGDKVLSYSVMIYSLGWGFGSFLVIVCWNFLSPWPDSYWVNWFFLANIVVGSVIGIIFTVWFGIGGSLDLYRMFERLKVHHTDQFDDGRVAFHQNIDDLTDGATAAKPLSPTDSTNAESNNT